MSDVRINVIATAETSQAEQSFDALGSKLRKSVNNELEVGGSGHEGVKETKHLKDEISGLASVIRASRHGVMGVAQSGGNPLPAAGNVIDDVAGMASKMGPIGLGLMVAGGAVMAVNAFSEQYEKTLPGDMKMAAQFGEIGGTSNENHRAFVSAMNQASEAAAKFGYNLNDGTAALTTMAAAGFSRGRAMSHTDEIFGYSRAYGIDPTQAAEFEATGGRYGNHGNLLGSAAAASGASGLGPGQYQEFLNATLSVFEEGLSRGIVKGYGEIEKTQILFGQIGPAWQGAMGAQRINQMSNSIESATSLSSDKDALIYRAVAGEMVGPKGHKHELSSEGYIKVFEQIEKGLTVQNFHAIMREIGKTTGNSYTDQIAQIAHTFGVNYTGGVAIQDLYKNHDLTEAQLEKDLKAVQAKDASSPEQKLLGIQTEMLTRIADIGSSLLPIKEGGIALLKGGLDTIAALLGAKVGSGQQLIRSAGIKDTGGVLASEVDAVIDHFTPEQKDAYSAILKKYSKDGSAARGILRSQYDGKSLYEDYADAVTSGDQVKLKALDSYHKMLQDQGSGATYSKINGNGYYSGVKSRESLPDSVMSLLSGVDLVKINHAEQVQSLSGAGGTIGYTGIAELIGGNKNVLAALLAWLGKHHPNEAQQVVQQFGVKAQNK